jgi:hypothetical protein
LDRSFGAGSSDSECKDYNRFEFVVPDAGDLNRGHTLTSTHLHIGSRLLAERKCEVRGDPRVNQERAIHRIHRGRRRKPEAVLIER